MKNRIAVKLLTLTLAVTMLFSACGGKDNSSTSSGTSSGSSSGSSSTSQSSSSPSVSSGDNSESETVMGEEVFLLEKIDKAKERNKDTKGWIHIPNTTIDDAVLQSKDNEYYLRLDEDKKYDIFGCYFADYENNLSSRSALSKNTIIYGHSDLKDNKDGKDFSQLFKFTDIDFVKNNPNIYFSIDGEDLVWEVFSVFFTNINFNYIQSNPSTADFNTIISESKARSQFIIDTTIGNNDKILTLSTCSAKYNPADKDNYRLVVMARLLPSDTEPKSQLNVTKNPSPKKS